MADTIENRLWTIRELAAYLNYQESTLAGMVTKNPERLPPRVAALGRPRWEPGVVRDWATQQSRGLVQARRQRPFPVFTGT
jgi:hypothetical protein